MLEREGAFSALRIVLAVSLTVLCGLSVCLGWVGPIAALRFDSGLIAPGIAFAAGIMTCLGLSAAALNPSLETAGAFFLGAAFMLLAECLLHGAGRRFAARSGDGPTGVGAALAVALHNVPECFLVFSSVMASAGLGLALGGTMVAHNIPLGISLAFSSDRKASPRQARRCAALAGLVPPLAAISAYFFLRPLFTPGTVRALFACAGGALVFIALAELAPLAGRYGKRGAVLAGFAAGVGLLLLVLLFSFRSPA
jgi:zinc transporter ZupT